MTRELSGNRQLFEAAFVQLRNLHRHAALGELAPEELRFARLRAGGEAVKIHDSRHLEGLRCRLGGAKIDLGGDAELMEIRVAELVLDHDFARAQLAVLGPERQ